MSTEIIISALVLAIESLLCNCQNSFSNTIGLVYIDVPDGKLQDGVNCIRNECSLRVIICIDNIG